MAFIRGMADTIASAGGTASGQKIQLQRSLADTTTTSDSVGRASIVFVRAVAEDVTVGTIDNVSRALTLTRAAADSMPGGADTPQIHNITVSLVDNTTLTEHVSSFIPAKPTGIRIRNRQPRPRVRRED